MTPRHEPEREPHGTGEPSEVSDAFRNEVTPLAPPPGAYDTLRQRARGRRRARVMWAGAAFAGCAAAVAITLTATSQGPAQDSVAVSDTAAGQDTPAVGGTAGPRSAAPDTAPPAADAPTRGEGTPGTSTGSAPPASGEPRAGGAEPAVCATGDLSLSVGPGEGAAGSLYRPLRVTNTSDTPCSLYGFPGVSLVDAAGHQVGKPADRSGPQASGRVVMKPGQREEATLRILDAAVATTPGCHPAKAAGLRVYPPGRRDSKILDVPGLKGCADDGVTTLTITSFGVH